MTHLLDAQYALVQDARATLLTYCATLAPTDFVTPVSVFNHMSMRDLLVHVANVYQHWLGVIAQQHLASYANPATITSVAAVTQLFEQVDALVRQYLLHATPTWLAPQPVHVPGRPEPLSFNPLTLFTHVLTHEFHHKGQLLSMSRQLGYTPVDTDVIRT